MKLTTFEKALSAFIIVVCLFILVRTLQEIVSLFVVVKTVIVGG